MESVEFIKALLAKNPEQGEMWFLLGNEYARQGLRNDALFAFSNALKYCNEELKLQISDEMAKLALIGEASNHICTDEDVDAGKDEGVDVGEDEDEDVGEDEDAWLTNIDVPSKHPDLPFAVFDGGRQEAEYDALEPEGEITFEDVGGLDEVKKSIRLKIIEPFEKPTLFHMFKKKIGGGILLYGPPGCGKTYLARATAGECRANFITVHITDILSKYIGESEWNIKNIFSSARSAKPCILFFDEVDSIGFNRAKLESNYMRGTVDQFLAEIDGIDTSTDGILVIGATNMPWDVDSAFKRPGRFDKTLFIPPPDYDARKVIFKLKLKERPVDAIDYEALAKQTELYTGADIESIVETASEIVIEDIMQSGAHRNITMQDLLKAREATRPSAIEWLRTIKNYVKYANQDNLYGDVSAFLNKHKKVLQ